MNSESKNDYRFRSSLTNQEDANSLIQMAKIYLTTDNRETKNKSNLHSQKKLKHQSKALMPLSNSGSDSSRVHYKPAINSVLKTDTFSSRAKQQSRLNAATKNKVGKDDIKSKTIKQNKQRLKDFTPKTPMNDLYKSKNFLTNNLQQSTRKTEVTPTTRAQGRARGRSTVSGIYDKAKLLNSVNLLNTSQISEENKSQNDENLNKIKALFMTFKLNHAKICGKSALTSRHNLLSNLDLPKVKEEPSEFTQKHDEIEVIEDEKLP